MSKNKFPIDQLTKSETLDLNSMKRLYALNLMCKLMEMKSHDPRLTRKQICHQLGFSDSTVKRYIDYIHMKSPYIRNNHKKKTNMKKANTIITSTQNLNKNENSNSTTIRKILKKMS